MINLLDEILEHFAANQQGMRPIKSLNPEWQAFTLRQGIEFGVAIEFNQEIEVNEESTSVLARKVLLLMEIKVISFFFLVLTKNIEMSLRNYAVIL